MYAKIKFSSGFEYPISREVFEGMVPKWRMSANMKFWKTPIGDLIVLQGSDTIEAIICYKNIPEDKLTEEDKFWMDSEMAGTKEEPMEETPHPKAKKPAGAKAKKEMTPEELAIIKEVEGKLPKEEPKTEEPEKKDPLAEMIEKSNCKHEPEKLTLFSQHTAKGVRYFPVCDFCGKRERYVSEKKILDGEYVGTANEHWTVEDIENAQEYTG